MELPLLTLNKSANRTILKQSALSPTSAKVAESTKVNDSIFGGFGGANSTAFSNTATKQPANATFSFTAALNSTTSTDETKTLGTSGGSSGGFLFGSGPTALFGGSSQDNKPAFGTNTNTKIFGGGNVTASSATENDSSTPADKTSTKSIFGGTGGFGAISSGSIFGGKSISGIDSTKSIFGTSSNSTLSAGNGTGNSIFGSSTTNTSAFGGFGSSNTTQGSIKFGSNAPFVGVAKDNNSSSFADLLKTSTAAIGFDSLAAKANNTNLSLAKSDEKSSPGCFIGLTNQNDFSNFSNSMKEAADTSIKNASITGANNSQKSIGETAGGGENDENYDPHYEPIIELPNEIVVSTGEEDETKLFGERATLYRWDATNKEWKERGRC